MVGVIRKYIIALVVLGCLYGCPEYANRDPIYFQNNTEKPIYVFYSCNDSTPQYIRQYRKNDSVVIDSIPTPQELLFETYQIGDKELKVADDRFPAYSSKSIVIDRFLVKTCKNKTMYFFLISVETMKKARSWEEIERNDLYIKKLKYSYEELKEMDWEIVYP